MLSTSYCNSLSPRFVAKAMWDTMVGVMCEILRKFCESICERCEGNWLEVAKVRERSAKASAKGVNVICWRLQKSAKDLRKVRERSAKHLPGHVNLSHF